MPSVTRRVPAKRALAISALLVLATLAGPSGHPAAAPDKAGIAAPVRVGWTPEAQTSISLLQPAAGGTVPSRPPVAGTGQPGDVVTLSVDGALEATGVIGRDGDFSLALRQALTDGIHTLAVDASDTAGNTTLVTAVITVDARRHPASAAQAS